MISEEEVVFTIFVITTIVVVAFAVVAPWATITAFKSSGRWAGWTMTWATLVAHAYTWFALGQSPEFLFFFAPLWGGYEFICSLAPLGLDEQEAEEAIERG